MNWKGTRNHGFSLVELAIAIGILCYGALIIYSLLPVALQVSKQARGDLRAAEIMDQVTGDFRTWEKMTNITASTPTYGFVTGFDKARGEFTTDEQRSLVIYQDNSTNSGAGERYTVAVSCKPLQPGWASRVAVTVARGRSAQFSFSEAGAVYTNQEGVSFTTFIVKVPSL